MRPVWLGLWSAVLPPRSYPDAMPREGRQQPAFLFFGLAFRENLPILFLYVGHCLRIGNLTFGCRLMWPPGASVMVPGVPTAEMHRHGLREPFSVGRTTPKAAAPTSTPTPPQSLA